MAGEAPAEVAIPEWAAGTVAVLCTAEVHAIPVSTAVRLSDSVVAFGLGKRRGSLERLRSDARCSLTVVAEDVACTLYGTAQEAGEVAGVVAVRLTVLRVVDHMTADFRIDAGVAWAWTDRDAEARDREVRAGIAGIHPGSG